MTSFDPEFFQAVADAIADEEGIRSIQAPSVISFNPDFFEWRYDISINGEPVHVVIERLPEPPEYEGQIRDIVEIWRTSPVRGGLK